MANIIGTKGNDTLVGSKLADTIDGLAGNDTITGNEGDDTLTGGGGKDEFVSFFYGGTDTITDFAGVGKGTNPTSAVIAEVDTLKFEGNDYLFTAQNLLLNQNGSNLEITFEDFGAYVEPRSAKVILQNFKLENLENLKASGGRPAIGNILFSGQTSITDSFNVLDANSRDTSLGIKNTVTFLNDLDNNITGFDDSDDVVNGQGGNDFLDGKSGSDLLRGGTGNDTLLGGAGNDTLVGGMGKNSLVGGIGDDRLNVKFSIDDNTLNGGAGNDILEAGNSGNNLLSGGDGNDYLSASFLTANFGDGYIASNGNNTLNGGAGNDTLEAVYSSGKNLLCGGDGNDYLSTSGYHDRLSDFNSSGKNTLNGGAGDDTLKSGYSSGNNLLSGGDGNDYLSISMYTTGNNTLNGGAGNDTLEAEYFSGNNLLSGGDGNDSLYLSPNTVLSDLTQTVDGGRGDDMLSVSVSATKGIKTTFNATTNIGSITAGTYQVSYKNIERLNIFGTQYDDLIVGSNGNDTLSGGYGGNDTIDGGKGDDLLSVSYYEVSKGITSTFNATTTIGSITAGTNLVSYKNIERLDISGTRYDDLIVGSNGNDTLSGGDGGNDTIDGGKGDDLFSADYYNVSKGITTSFNATTNIGSITANGKQVSYKNIERLNIRGTQYNDLIVGSNGNDTLSGGYGGNDTIDGGKGDDLLSASFFYDQATKGITSTFNATTNIGSITANTNGVSYKNIERLNIFGTRYDDLIVGSNGNDTLSGSYSNDSLIGGAGTDTFAFNSFDEGVDILYDFNTTNELIQVLATGFDDVLSSGSLKATQFTIGTSATTSEQRFIYNSATGGLFFDSDGSKSGYTQVQFAQLSVGLSVTENNFVVV